MPRRAGRRLVDMSEEIADVELNVAPQYGWGWLERAPDRPIAVPPPFAFRARAARPNGRFVATGLVDRPGHLLDGLWLRLEQRHREWDGVCDLSVYGRLPRGENLSSEDEVYHGYARVDPI
ncbi:MAG: hypothetical protein WB816_10050 [Methylocystis sp.]